MSDPKLPPQGADEPLELDLEASPAPSRKGPVPAPAAPRAAKTSDPGARAQRPAKSSDPGARGQRSDFKATGSNPGLRVPVQATPSPTPSNPSLGVVGPAAQGAAAESRPPATTRPFHNSGQAVAQALAIAARWLVSASLFGFSKAKKHGGKALSDFNQRPEHTRWRSYAFGVYGALVLTTFAVQLWEPNSLAAYVRVQRVALPDSTVIFVRNESKKPWKDVKLLLNGLYSYERNELTPSSHVQLPVDRFGIYDPSGKVTYAPKDLVLKTLSIDCDRGHYEQELGQ